MTIPESILQIITENQPIKRNQIRFILLHGCGHNITDRTLRKEVELLIANNHCIESSEKGYSLIKSQADLDRSMRYLRKKALAIFKRANQLQKNFHRDKDKQLSITEFMEE